MKKHVAYIASFFLLLFVVLLYFGLADNESNLIKVRVWSADGQNKLLMTKKVDEFNETIGKEKGIKIEYRVIRDDIDNKIAKKVKKGDVPELFGGGGTLIGLRETGDVIPINALPGGSEFLRARVPELIVPITEDGKERNVYSFGIRKITGRLIYNKDLFKKAGIVDENGEPTPPETWDEFIEYAKRIHEYDSTKFGVAFPMAEPSIIGYGLSRAVSESLGAKYEKDEANNRIRCLGPELAVDILRRVKKDGSCFPGAQTLNNDTLRHQFAQGNIGMFFACSWDVGVLTEQFPAKCNWGVAPYPTLEKGVRYKESEFINGTMSIGVSALKSEKKAKAVMEVFKWLYSEEMLLEHYESEQWILVDENIRKKADESKMSEQWLAFCKNLKVAEAPEERISLKNGMSNTLLIDAWAGEISFDELVERANEEATEAYEKEFNDDL